MNKITIDMSEFNNTSECECELTVIKLNGVIIQFPKVYISDTYYNVKPHTELIDEISGEFNFMPLVDDDGVQYREINREIREVKG
jgi:hypothetical protein